MTFVKFECNKRVRYITVVENVYLTLTHLVNPANIVPEDNGDRSKLCTYLHSLLRTD